MRNHDRSQTSRITSSAKGCSLLEKPRNLQSHSQFSEKADLMQIDVNSVRRCPRTGRELKK